MDKDTKTYNILIIEDNPGDLLLIEDYIEDHILDPQLDYAATYEEAKKRLSLGKDYDIILLDLTLPDLQGEALISEIVKQSNNVPVIILTGYTDIDFSVTSLKMGIADYLIKDAINSYSLYKSIVHNISRRKFILALQESEKRYNNLFHLSPQPMWVYDRESLQILDVNNAAITKFGYSFEEFKTKSLLDFNPVNENNFLEDFIPENFSEHMGYMGDFRYKTKEGDILDVEIHISPITYYERPACIMQANDISERLKYINAIEKQNEKLRNISWIQSHLVRAPLARMMTLLHAMQDPDLMEPGESGFYFEQLNKSAEELDELIRDISRKAAVKDFDKN
ncbi:hypothetical protein LPB144_00865 [Christiangramia salexigens]|uniref:Histidine kinase n=1 Tax=Christiangramia salexigens TaxID=1913577 RepID=A0A1L3J1M4_9FLAO|nr:hypothetical protein LPB144_00865 [Christiangramia salexigens]